MPEKEAAVSETKANAGIGPDHVQPLDPDTVVAELLDKDYITRGVAIGGHIYTIKTFTGTEFSMFTRLYNYRLDSLTSTPRAVLVEHMRTECMLPFILYAKDGEPVSPITEDLKKAWVVLDTTGECIYKDRVYKNQKDFFKELYSTFYVEKILTIPTVVTGIIAEEYNNLIKEVEKILKGDSLKN